MLDGYDLEKYVDENTIGVVAILGQTFTGAYEPVEAIAKKLGHEPTEEELKQARAEARQRYLEWQKGETWAGWRVATVDEVIELLEKALG